MGNMKPILRKITRHKYLGLVLLSVTIFFFMSTSSTNNTVTTDVLNSQNSLMQGVQDSLNQAQQEGQLHNQEEEEGVSATDSAPAPWSQTRGKLHMPADKRSYFLQLGHLRCLKEGVESALLLDNATECPCKKNWFGRYCCTPEAVMFSNRPSERYPSGPIFGKPTRKIINALTFDLEFDLLEARFGEFGDLVDAFLIFESNYTSYGEAKPLRLLERLRAGDYKDVASKIVHVVLDSYPGAGVDTEKLAMDYLGTQGFAQQLSGYIDDDLVILNEPDEIPSRDILLYFKTHEGYPEPISIQMTWSFFGYFWRHGQLLWVSDSVVTAGFLQHVLSNKAHHIRRGRELAAAINATINATSATKEEDKEILGRWKNYARVHGRVEAWMVGSVDSLWKPFSTHSGWYCSHCLPPEDIAQMLATSRRGDSPRWRDVHEYRNASVIQELIRTGGYFGGSQRFLSAENTTTRGENFAPRHLLQNPARFKHLLVNPYTYIPK